MNVPSKKPASMLVTVQDVILPLVSATCSSTVVALLMGGWSPAIYPVTSTEVPT